MGGVTAMVILFLWVCSSTSQRQHPAEYPSRAARSSTLQTHRLPRIGNLFRTDFRFAPSPRSASLAGPPIHEGHGRPRSVRKSSRLRLKHLSTGLHRGDLQKGNVYASWCQFPSTRAQKCRFCARKARKWGFRSRKAHKNLDFVLKKLENEGSEGQKRTKTPILCSGGLSPACRLEATSSTLQPQRLPHVPDSA